MAGSKRRAREYWADQVRRWRGSGKTCATFARDAGVNPKTLSWWARKLDEEHDSGAAPVQTELPFIELMPITIDARIELELGDITIRVPNDFDGETLMRVLDLLRSR